MRVCKYVVLLSTACQLGLPHRAPAAAPVRTWYGMLEMASNVSTATAKEKVVTASVKTARLRLVYTLPAPERRYAKELPESGVMSGDRPDSVCTLGTTDTRSAGAAAHGASSPPSKSNDRQCTVGDGVADAVAVGEPVCEPVWDAEGVPVCELEGVPVDDADAVPLCDGEAVCVCEALAVAVADALGVPVEDGDGVTVPLLLGVRVPDDELVPVCDGDGVAEDVAVMDGVAVCDAVTDDVAVVVGVMDGVCDALLVPVWLALGVCVWL